MDWIDFHTEPPILHTFMLGQKVCIREVIFFKNMFIWKRMLWFWFQLSIASWENMLLWWEIHCSLYFQFICVTGAQQSIIWKTNVQVIGTPACCWSVIGLWCGKENIFTFVMTLQFYTWTTHKLHKNKNIPPIQWYRLYINLPSAATEIHSALQIHFTTSGHAVYVCNIKNVTWSHKIRLCIHCPTFASLKTCNHKPP